MNRRYFLTATGGAAATAVALVAREAEAMTQDEPVKTPPYVPPSKSTIPDRGPRLDNDLVKAFVGAGHGDLAKVEALLKQEPRLINATWDWGGGDWETALGGAAHMGRHEIAHLLLERGARLDIFAAAMLGQLEVVKAAVIAFPGTVRTLGPHGIPLLAHAKAGGKEAEAVKRYLEDVLKGSGGAG